MSVNLVYPQYYERAVSNLLLPVRYVGFPGGRNKSGTTCGPYIFASSFILKNVEPGVSTASGVSGVSTVLLKFESR